jgi:hypothetical protein
MGYSFSLSTTFGHGRVITLAKPFAEMVERFLKLNKASQGAVILKKAYDALVLLGGVYVIYTVY